MLDDAIDDPTEIVTKDGTKFSVHSPGGGLVIVTAPTADEAAASTGLAAYRTRVQSDGKHALHEGMPVEVVRAYCRAHGGIEHAGFHAVALLKTLPSVPTDSPAPTAKEPAPPVAAPPAPLVLDDLTDAVILARRAVADFTGPLEWKWGRLPSDQSPIEEALWRRITHGRGLGSRLGMAQHARYERHPLRDEALALRETLLATAEDALAQRKEGPEGVLRRYREHIGRTQPAASR